MKRFVMLFISALMLLMGSPQVVLARGGSAGGGYYGGGGHFGGGGMHFGGGGFHSGGGAFHFNSGGSVPHYSVSPNNSSHIYSERGFSFGGESHPMHSFNPGGSSFGSEFSRFGGNSFSMPSRMPGGPTAGEGIHSGPFDGRGMGNNDLHALFAGKHVAGVLPGGHPDPLVNDNHLSGLNRDAFHRDPARWNRADRRWDRDLDDLFCNRHHRFCNDDFAFIGFCAPWWWNCGWWGGWGLSYVACPTGYYDYAYYESPDDYAEVSGYPSASYGGYETEANPAPDLRSIAAAFLNDDITGAEAQLSQALTARPYDAQLSYIYAYVLACDGKYNPAAQMLRRAVVLDGEMLKRGDGILGGLYRSDIAQAILPSASDYMDENPRNTEAPLVKAYIEILLGQNAAARGDLARVLGLNRQDLEAARLMGMIAGQAY